MTAVGIHDLAIATAHHVVGLADLAARRDVDPGKYLVGLGQESMSFPAEDEDVVTMGAAAARTLLHRTGADGVRWLLFATESGVDQSKSAAVYAHRLLGLPPSVRAVELKQACYGGTAALQTALGIVHRDPAERVLVIAADVARYALHSPGEPTQGAGAAAMLVSADPALLEVEPVSGVATADVDDFWRPNDASTAVVDGRLSVSAYLAALKSAWDDHRARGGATASEIDRFVYHQPFTRMAEKAHAALARHVGLPDGERLGSGLEYNRRLGNTYTASLYAALAALLDGDDALAGRRIGLFSYGSGSVGEFFTGVVRPGYDAVRPRDEVTRALAARVPLSVDEYERLHAARPTGSADAVTRRVTDGPYRFAGVRSRARRYENTADRPSAAAEQGGSV
ncbi:hydroxymethylglutaryl-CoA synthase [Microbacterium marinilacus]|uniref:Hydroxymethylglutaryl-CoA synthase n=1 Tax=Microbacterium marinilacus TaxID=415209 RepID=A0ABP7BHD6_9MICO|nr:hydroxymethylglutaryl-CoA synthase [Microbacterium marinilacus]MBY0688884.1 hydroxymethylglutaryl-CoA synthase [Microbacterium marinilacus]